MLESAQFCCADAAEEEADSFEALPVVTDPLEIMIFESLLSHAHQPVIARDQTRQFEVIA